MEVPWRISESEQARRLTAKGSIEAITPYIAEIGGGSTIERSPMRIIRMSGHVRRWADAGSFGIPKNVD
jgi:hypothetical protein